MAYIFRNTNKLDTLILGEKSKFSTTAYLFTNTTYPYTGKWVHKESGTTYQSSVDLLSNYVHVGEYTREILGTTKLQSFSIGIDEVESTVEQELQASETIETNETKNITNSSATEASTADEKTVTTTTETIELTEPVNSFEELAWNFDEESQTLTFTGGKLANVSKEQTIATLIEQDSRLNGQKIKKIRFTEKIKAAESLSY